MRFMERERKAWQIVVAAGSLAFIASVAEARDWKIQADSDQQIRAHGYCAGKNRRTCVEIAVPKVEITVPPKNGTITFGNDTSSDTFIRVGEVRVGRPACPAVPVHCAAIFYTSKADYHGSDQFSYSVLNADGQKWNDTITVDVH
jgi:hypothetical protein